MDNRSLDNIFFLLIFAIQILTTLDGKGIHISYILEGIEQASHFKESQMHVALYHRAAALY